MNASTNEVRGRGERRPGPVNWADENRPPQWGPAKGSDHAKALEDPRGGEGPHAVLGVVSRRLAAVGERDTAGRGPVWRVHAGDQEQDRDEGAQVSVDMPSEGHGGIPRRCDDHPFFERLSFHIPFRQGHDQTNHEAKDSSWNSSRVGVLRGVSSRAVWAHALLSTEELGSKDQFLSYSARQSSGLTKSLDGQAYLPGSDSGSDRLPGRIQGLASAIPGESPERPLDDGQRPRGVGCVTRYYAGIRKPGQVEHHGVPGSIEIPEVPDKSRPIGRADCGSWDGPGPAAWTLRVGHREIRGKMGHQRSHA